jgi:hypothetical protein
MLTLLVTAVLPALLSRCRRSVLDPPHQVYTSGIYASYSYTGIFLRIRTVLDCQFDQN